MSGTRRFAGKVAIVTGGAGNIGRATARLLASEGAAVTVADLDHERVTTVVDTIVQDGGVARGQVVDVSHEDSVAAMVHDTVAAYGGLDVLHNNAAAIALNGEDQDIVSMEVHVWRRVLDVNLTGPMLGCHFAIPAMLERGGGAIVNTASAAAFYGSRTLAAYGTSKAGLVALTRYVATAYSERGIRCNAVAPGVVVSPELQEQLGGAMGPRLAGYTENHLVGRLGYPEEVAAAVAFLASDDALFITGETLRVDGGLTAHSPGHRASQA
jgi:NAD(P)-dependent dehydrogenase (short-subunit alcohol dehydrogenase family)